MNSFDDREHFDNCRKKLEEQLREVKILLSDCPTQELKNDMLKLALAGRYQSGKSTLFNYMCGGRELSPMGHAGIRATACPVSAQYAENESATVYWKAGEDMPAGIDDPVVCRELEDSAWSFLCDAAKKPSPEELEAKRFELVVAHFYHKFKDRQETIVSFDALGELAAIPHDWKAKWKRLKESGSRSLEDFFTPQDVAFAFINRIELHVKSEILEKLACKVYDCPGFGASRWDDERAWKCLKGIGADAVLFVYDGTKIPGESEIRLRHECEKELSEPGKCRPFIHVVNKRSNRLNDKEINEALNHPKLHYVNALRAYEEAQTQRSEQGSETSVFADELEKIIRKSRGYIILVQNGVDQLLRQLEQECDRIRESRESLDREIDNDSSAIRQDKRKQERRNEEKRERIDELDDLFGDVENKLKDLISRELDRALANKDFRHNLIEETKALMPKTLRALVPDERNSSESADKFINLVKGNLDDLLKNVVLQECKEKSKYLHKPLEKKLNRLKEQLGKNEEKPVQLFKLNTNEVLKEFHCLEIWKEIGKVFSKQKLGFIDAVFSIATVGIVEMIRNFKKTRCTEIVNIILSDDLKSMTTNIILKELGKPGSDLNGISATIDQLRCDQKQETEKAEKRIKEKEKELQVKEIQRKEKQGEWDKLLPKLEPKIIEIRNLRERFSVDYPRPHM